MNDLTPIKAGEIIEAVIARGDIAQLSPQERAKYYVRVCESVGLNPMTRPFEYITLNGKLTLYARKDCTDQLRSIHGVSVCDLTDTERDGVFIVTAKVENSRGRKDASKGAVSITGLKGEALANALMKAETKAKRRATLSICGLGFLDETEIDSIPGARVGTDPNSYPEPPMPPAIPKATKESPTEAPGAPAERAAADSMVTEGTRHDADGVVWDETGERPATAADEPEPPKPDAPLDMSIPGFLDRRKQAKADKPKPAKTEPPKFDAVQWIKDLEGAATGASDMDQLVKVQQKVQMPAKGKVTPDQWAKGKAIVLAASARILGEGDEDDEVKEPINPLAGG